MLVDSATARGSTNPRDVRSPSVANAHPSQSSLRAVAAVTALSLAQLLVQFATQLILARLFGAESEMDAFVAALAPPVVMATILSGSLGYVLVPVFAERLASGGPREATAVTSQIGVYLLGASILLAAVWAAAAQALAGALYPGFPPAQQALTAELSRVLALLVVFNSLIAFLNALYHCEGVFAWPAVAGVLGTVVTLGYVVAFHADHGIFAVAWGVIAGALVTTAVLLPRFLWALGQPLARQLAPHAGTRQALSLLLPLVLGAIYWRLDPLVDRWLGSYLAAGSIAHIGYAWRLTLALMMVGTSGLSIVSFPAIAAHAAAHRPRELNHELSLALRRLVFLLAPVCLGVGLFARPCVQLLFEHGKFTPADTRAVALLLVLYLGVVPGASIGDLLSRTLYALQDTRTPVVMSGLVFTICVGLKVLLTNRLGGLGLAAATSAYYALHAGALAVIMRHRLGREMLLGVAGSLARCLLAAALACLAAGLVASMTMPLAILAAMGAGAVVYLLCAWLLGEEAAVHLIGLVRGPRSTDHP
jgi:putative peptidoglycan lipid II flippase